MARARWRTVLVSVGIGLFSAMGAAAAGAAPGFHSPVTLPGSTDGNEPSLAISPRGVRYASWQSPGEFASSRDGVHFANLGSPDSTALGDVTNAVDAAGALYNAQICGGATILHTCLYRSLDGGHTWPQQTVAADSHPGASDRPWIDVFPHQRAGGWNPALTTVYLEYHTFSPEDLAYVTVSRDGGKTFSAPILIETGTNALTDSGCNTIPSGVVVDDGAGIVYALWLSGNDVAANLTSGCNYSQLGPFNKAWVSTSRDGGVTWKAHLAWKGAFDPATKIGDNADKIFGTIAVDRSGQIHVALAVRKSDDPTGYVASCETGSTCQEAPEPTDLLLVTSPDHGRHWTKPFVVRHGGSTFFPWSAGGSAGVVDTDYYKSATLRPNDPASVWAAGYTRITGASAVVDATGTHYVQTPSVASRTLEDPIHNGGICTFGIFCSVVPNANRDLADSIAIALDPAGGANAVWTNDASGTSRIDFSCQNSGPSGYAGKPALTRCFRTE